MAKPCTLTALTTAGYWRRCSADVVGIPVLESRRVAGLRREEVAMLAGISAD